MDQFIISVFIYICPVLHNNALKTLQERQAPWTQNIKKLLNTTLYMWFTKTNTALCLYKLFNLHFQRKVLMQSMCLNCKEYQYVRWHVLSCRDSRLCPLSSSSSPLLPPFLSASLLSLPFSSVFWKQRSPCITKPIFSARSFVLQTSQVMINKNTQQWKLQQSTSVGVSERYWSRKPTVLYDLVLCLVEDYVKWKTKSSLCGSHLLCF